MTRAAQHILLCLALAAAPLCGAQEEPPRHQRLSLTTLPVSPPSEPAGLPPLPAILTLREAEAYAIAHQPSLAGSFLRAQAETQRVYEARSQFFPQVQADSVAVRALGDDSRLAANSGISNPTILTRQSDGALLSQLITDFGRTYYLTTSARSTAISAADRTELARETLLFRVDQAYFAAQGAEALLQVADQTVSTNQVLFDRVKALAEPILSPASMSAFSR